VTKKVQQRDRVIIRFAGDSGDGMQLTGDRFTQETASFGNDLSTLPNFPAEIRAPAGTLPGVSSFQVHFADHDILTPGDAPDVLVAMNPAALKANIGDLPRGADIIANTDEFSKRNLTKVGYAENPLEDGSLSAYQLHALPITSVTVKALENFEVSRKEAERAKNMFALGLLSWLYNRTTEGTMKFLESKFAAKPEIMKANKAAFQAGWNYGETTEAFSVQYEVKPATLAPGTYRNITGNGALSLGLVAASRRSGLPLFLGSYPITPASDILHELAKHKRFGVRTFQAEDEIGGVGAALGAAFGGALGVTTTSGPGMCLKGETIGLAVSVELPLIVCDIQRAGPSTGMPTKTEQADLLMALFGRNGESPVAVVAPATPSDCFDIAIEAVRIAVKYRTPVIILSDGYLANGSEPWRVPKVADLPRLRDEFSFSSPGEWRAAGDGDKPEFLPFQRDPRTLARPWAIPGMPGLEHRIGGIEKADVSGTISYDPDNHDRMVRLRQAKIDGIAADIGPLEVDDPDDDARVLVLGWGSTFGSIGAAVRRVRLAGGSVAQAHLRHLSPFPANIGEVLRAYDKVLVPEINLGQLALILRGRYLVDVISYNRVRGLPFRAAELAGVIQDVISNV
jgi:2-oxoglutarate ferredoxin oxidoreductase subunit alpha